MSETPPSPLRGRLPFVVAAGALLVGATVAAAIGINRVAGRDASATFPTPVAYATSPAVAATTAAPSASATASTSSTPAPTPTASATPATGQIAFADCSKVSFGAPLQPKDQPADVHVYSAPPAMQIDTSKLYEATIHTAKGDIVLCLQPELAPKTVNNFVALARNHFFDGLKVPRVEPGFVIQTGSPSNDQQGGPGYQFEDEPVRQQYVDGSLAMANSGPNTNGSQFFICIGDDTTKLQPKYNLFGKVQSGLDVAKQIAVGDVMNSVVVAEQA